MIESTEALRVREHRSHGLLQRSREVRARAAALRSEARATREAVADLIQQARAIGASLRRSRPASFTLRLDYVGHEPMQSRPPLEDARLVARVPARGVVLQALTIAGLHEDDLYDLIDDLAAAYADARAWDDAETCTLLREALTRIGRHLARRVGPKAAGATMN